MTISRHHEAPADVGVAVEAGAGGTPLPGGAPTDQVSGRRRLLEAVTARLFAGPRVLRLSLGMVAVIVMVAIAAPLVARYDAVSRVGTQFESPSLTHFFGTDELGRDIWSRVVYGLRTSVLIGALTALFAGGVGTLAGLYSGYVGGWRDSLIMRTVDFLLGFPALVVAMVVVAVAGPSKTSPIGAAIIIGIPLCARVIRGSVLSERNKEYVLAARALGASTPRILIGTLLPAILPVVLVQAAVVAALAIQLEAGLSFLGLGVPPPEPSLGSMLADAKGFLPNAPLYGVFPGLALALVIGALTVLSMALEATESVDVAQLKQRASSEVA